MSQYFRKWMLLFGLVCTFVFSAFFTVQASDLDDIYDLEPIHYYSIDQKDESKELSTFYYDKDADKNEFYMIVEEYAYDRATSADESRLSTINPYGIEDKFAWGSRCNKEDYQDYVTVTKVRTVNDDSDAVSYTVYKIVIKESFENIIAARATLTMDMLFLYEDIEADENQPKDYEKNILLVNRSTEMLLRKADYDSGTYDKPYPDPSRSDYENTPKFVVGYHKVELSLGSLINLGLTQNSDDYENTEVISDFDALSLLDERGMLVENGVAKVEQRSDVFELFLPEAGNYTLCYEKDEITYKVYITAVLQELGFYEPVNGAFVAKGSNSFAYRSPERDSSKGQDYVIYFYARECEKHYWSDELSDFQVIVLDEKGDSLLEQVKVELIEKNMKWESNKDVYTSALLKLTIPSTLKGKVRLSGVAGVTDGLSSIMHGDLGYSIMLDLIDLAPTKGVPKDDPKDVDDKNKDPNEQKPAGASQKTDESQAQPEKASLKVGDKITVKDITYKVKKTTKDVVQVEVTGTKKKDQKSIAIPATVTYKDTKCKVTGIGSYAFKSNSKCKKIALSAGITKIGKKAFSGISPNATVVVPKKSYKQYQAMIKKSGIKKTIKIKKK